LEPFIGSMCLCVCLYSDCKITKWIKLRMLETPPSETALLNALFTLGLDVIYQYYDLEMHKTAYDIQMQFWLVYQCTFIQVP